MPLDILQEVGSYAGLAAVVGLAVLSALYFSQARDVKRLREWAGRAPERSAEEVAQAAAAPAPSGGVVARPQPKPAAQPAGGPRPAGAPAGPVPAQTAAAGAAPATAVGGAGPKPAPAGAPAGTEQGEAGEEAKEREPAVAAAGPKPAVAAGTATGAQDSEAGEEAKEREPAVAAAAGEREALAAQGAQQAAASGDSDALAAQGAQQGAQAAGAQKEAAAPGAQSAAARRQKQAAAAGKGDTQEREALAPPQAAPVPQAAAAAGAGAATPEAPTGAGARAPEAPGPGVRAGTQAPPRPKTAGTPRPPAPRQPGGPPSVPGGGPREPLRPGRRPAQTAIIPPPARAPWYRRLLASPRYLVLVIAGLLIVGGGAVFGLSQLTSEESGSPRQAVGGEAEPVEDGERPRRRPVVPSEVTVAVLNGTTVPGLAAQIGDRIETFGFDLGTVTNSTDQQRAESVVLFAPGHGREAVVVGRRLSIGQRERVDPESQGLAGDATVVVIAGIDQTQ